MTQDLIWSILLILLAAVLLALEFSLPTGGLLGLGTLIALGGGLFLAFHDSVTSGIVMSGVVVVVFPIVLSVAVRVWPHTPIGRRVLNLPPDDLAPAMHQVDERQAKLAALIGQVGIAKTNLLPGGLVEIQGARWDVVAQGTAVDAGNYVEVTSVEAGKIRVRATERRPVLEENPPVTPSEDDYAAKTLEELDLDDLADPLA